MKVKIYEGLEFISNDAKHKFVCKKWHFYDNEEIWCAFDDKNIYPLNELDLTLYIPKINGKYINENNEYEY